MSIEVKAAEMLMDAGISLLNPVPALAAMVVSLAHFKAFLRATPRDKRRPAYEALKPYLKFNVPSFALMNVDGRTKRMTEPVSQVS